MNDILQQLQACKVSLSLATNYVEFESDAYAQILQWSADLNFVEMLIGMWMDKTGLEREKRITTKHHLKINHNRPSRALLNDEWIGRSTNIG